MNNLIIEWKKIQFTGLYSDVINCQTIFLSKITTAVNYSTVQDEYNNRTNQARLDIIGSMTQTSQIMDGVLYDVINYEFGSSESLLNTGEYPLLLFADSQLRNVAYVILTDPVIISGNNGEFVIDITIRLSAKTVDPTISNDLGLVRHYKSINSPNQPRYKYRGITKDLVDEQSQIKVKPLLGALAEEINGINYFYDFRYFIPLYVGMGQNLESIKVLVDETNISWLYWSEIVSPTKKAVYKAKLINKSTNGNYLVPPSERITLLEITSDRVNEIFLVPYLDAVVENIIGHTYIYYYQYPNDPIEVKSYGYRIFNSKVYLNGKNVTYLPDELGILEDAIPGYESYYFRYISQNFLAYARKDNLDDIKIANITYKDGFINLTEISQTFSNKVEIRELNPFTIIVIENGLFRIYYRESSASNLFTELSNLADIRNYFRRYKLSSNEIPSQITSTNANLISGVINYSGLWYYLGFINNCNALYLV